MPLRHALAVRARAGGVVCGGAGRGGRRAWVEALLEARAARPAALPPGTTLPLRVQLMKHWAAGLFQAKLIL